MYAQEKKNKKLKKKEEKQIKNRHHVDIIVCKLLI